MNEYEYEYSRYLIHEYNNKMVVNKNKIKRIEDTG
jgi:hypothetical protein